MDIGHLLVLISLIYCIYWIPRTWREWNADCKHYKEEQPEEYSLKKAS